MERTDVVVVGAGPTGCMLAGELARAGRSVTVVDKHTSPSTLSRAFGVHARTLEILDARGLADSLVATGAPAPGLKLWRGATLRLDRLPTRFPHILVTPQLNVDTLLEKYARGAGATVIRGVTATDVTDHGDHVVVRGHDESGNEHSWEASYVVGADGAHSVVRDLVGQSFPGKAILRSIMLADVRLAHPPTTLVSVDAKKDCFAFLAPFGDGWFRIIAWNRQHQTDDDAPLDAEEVRRTFETAMGTDYGFGEVRWVGRFHADERQVPRYRTGRVFLAGDAAHVHSPAGGQGMNTGIQDAMNLGWKLAAALNGADDDVLDTYHAERHPVGALVLRTSGATLRMMTVRSWMLRMVRNAVVGNILRVPRVSTKIAGMFSGVGISYGHERGEHRLVGTRAVDVPTTDGRLYEVLRGGGFVLVTEKGSETMDQHDFTGPVLTVRRTDEGSAMLVRPDGYVAWAGSSTSDGWRAALARWTGAVPREPESLESAAAFRVVQRGVGLAPERTDG